MTFSICARETYAVDGEEYTRFGGAVTTRTPGVGTLCPFAGEHGAIATQASVNSRLGRKGIEYLDDGLAIRDALGGLLNADAEPERRQLHGVDREGTFAHSGSGCSGWFGHREGENFTVAGNLLVGETVVDATAERYEGSDRDRPLAGRLVDALAAGYAEGGDKRTDLVEQSAAVKVASTEPPPETGRYYYNDLRVDASEEPIEALQRVYELSLGRSA